MSQLDITKRALAEIGTRTTISAMNDGSAEANYGSLLFIPLRDFLLREGDYDWALKTAAAVAAGGLTTPWAFSYTYPADALRIRQLIPTTYAVLDPLPIEWNVINSIGIRYIVSKQAAAQVMYTFGADDSVWDPIFSEAFVRLYGSALAFALENRIEASDKLLREAISFAGIANLRDS